MTGITVLGIETSCDETAAAIVRLNDGEPEILSNIVFSQLAEHAPFGGVVPEIAARAHVANLDTVIARAAREAGVIVKGGGHAMAGGFTVLPDRIPDFREFMKAHVGAQSQNLPAHPESPVDAVMNVRALSIDLARLVHGSMAPYGAGYAEPSFVLTDVLVVNADIVGTNHVRCTIRDRDGGPTVKAVAFRAGETPLGKFLLTQARDSAVPIHLLGAVQINAWQGRESAEFHIADGWVGYI